MHHSDDLQQHASDAQILANAFYRAQQELAAMRQLACYVFPLLNLAMSAGKLTASDARWIFMDLETANDIGLALELKHPTLEALRKEQADEAEGPQDLPQMFLAYQYWNDGKPKPKNKRPPVPIFDSNYSWAALWQAYSRHVTEGRNE